MSKYSFELGWSQVMQKDVPEVKAKIMEVLKIKNRISFSQRLTGKIVPKMSEKEAIEQVFAEYGIKKVWGEKQTANAH